MLSRKSIIFSLGAPDVGVVIIVGVDVCEAAGNGSSDIDTILLMDRVKSGKISMP